MWLMAVASCTAAYFIVLIAVESLRSIERHRQHLEEGAHHVSTCGILLTAACLLGTAVCVVIALLR